LKYLRKLKNAKNIPLKTADRNFSPMQRDGSALSGSVSLKVTNGGIIFCSLASSGDKP
jgi:hypothetical protein